MEKLVIAGREFNSRLFLGTGKFNSNEVMEQAILASGTEMVTVAMKRIDMDNKEDDMLKHIIHPNIQLLPNTSGVRNAEEAVFAAQLAREAFGTNWLKLEIHPDPRYLLPDSIETLKATEELVKLGFIVLPYCQADPVLCKRLEEAGAATVMPLGAPIGTNKGLQTKEFLQIIIEQAGIPVVVDAGIGWNHPPFELTKSDGKLYGRGTTDDKGPAVSVLYGLKAAEETGLIKKPVRFIVGCNEENGSDDLEYYCKKEALPEKLYTPDGQYPVINIEKGMIRGKFSKKLAENSPKKYILKIHGGDTVNAVPSEAFAEICGFSEDEINIGNDFLYEDLKDSIKIISKGVSAHASTPENGKNALTKLIKFLSHLDFDNQISDTLKSLFEIFPYGETNGEHAGVKCSDDKSGALTLVLSVLEFDGTNFEGIFDIRFPVSFKSDEINSKIQKTLQSHGFDYECILASEPHYVDENSDFVQSLLKVYENLTGEKGKCIAIGGGTYVHNTPGGVAFGAEMPGKEYNIHCADEYTIPEEMILNAEMTANAVIEICG